IPDMKLQMMAWRNHFASIFGMKALEKVRGFSPPEMHLPIHPDVCYEYVKTLKECGYEWLMVQEHTVENLDGRGIRNPHYPHKLVAKNSEGKVEEITILVKTQGSDTKLVAQMQPYYEAKGLDRRDYCGKKIPAFVLQIGDGENGGVMMNEFPPGYKIAYGEIEKSGTVGMNGSEYLDFLKEEGVDEEDYTPVQPIGQHRIWEHVGKFYPGACDDAIKKVKERDQSFNLDKGSWTSDKNWVHGYENVLDPMNKLSVAFHRRFGDKKTAVTSHKYKEALLYLLLSQTSCFRYWGQGIWTEYAKEIIRRGMEAVK
ncbi:MAG TPA: glycosyl hydrolase family 57, partial [Candidatus Omnitrophota bacterium]|nr:glycosyl hydrolase family 57 [Candidatus Omnitrophota bacterium]